MFSPHPTWHLPHLLHPSSSRPNTAAVWPPWTDCHRRWVTELCSGAAVPRASSYCAFMPKTGFVKQCAHAMIEAARPRQRIDVVNGLARIVPLRLVASYFGMPGPDDPTMMRWMRDIFHYIFADLTNSPTVYQDAVHSIGELRRH